MKILDTDTLTLFFSGHERVVSRRQKETDEVAITIISRIETLQGRFAMLLKAADGAERRGVPVTERRPDARRKIGERPAPKETRA